MANQNDFVSFATGSSANTLTAASYNALSTLIANGFQTGVAQSAEVNTVLRQTSSIAAMIAQFAATGGPMVDDGDIATMLASFQAALKGYSGFLTVTSPGANVTIAPSSLVTIVQPTQASGTITLTINAGSINGQRLIVYGNANGGTIVNSVATSGNPAFSLPNNTNVYTTSIPASYSTFVEMLWDGSNWRILPIYAFAPLASPAFTGIPTAPTAAPGAANTQLANTQWVSNYFAKLSGSPSQIFNAASGASGSNVVNYAQLTNNSFVANLKAAYAEGMSAGGSTTIPILWGFGNYAGNTAQATSQSLGTSVSFTANTRQLLIINANGGTGSAQVSGCGFNWGGVSVIAQTANWSSGATLSTGSAIAVANAGASVYVYYYTTSATSSVLDVGLTVASIPIP